MQQRQIDANAWNDHYLRGQYFSQLCDHTLDAITKYFDATARVLDVGCGRGELITQLRLRGFDVAGIDLSSEAVTLAQAANPSVAIHQGDIERDLCGHYDVIVMNMVLSFMRDLDSILERIRNCCDALALITPVLKHGHMNDQSLQDIGVPESVLNDLLAKHFSSVTLLPNDIHLSRPNISIYIAR